MTKIVSIINLKGGVAKTTTTIQLAECLSSEFAKNVLVIDLDPQTNATIALIGEARWQKLNDQKQTIFHLFDDKLHQTSYFNISNALQKGVSNLRIPCLSLLASSLNFINIQDSITKIPEQTGYSIPTPMEVLKTAVHSILPNYDYILIDCPPNLGYITRNGIEISDYFLIPTIPDILSTYGIPQIVKTIHGFANTRHLKIRCLGLIITKYSSNSEVHKRGMKNLSPHFANIFDELQIPQAPVFKTWIPQANATAEAMEFEKKSSTFREKYGRSTSGDQLLYSYVNHLTREFIQYVGN
jgi:chromosome partitioning protein